VSNMKALGICGSARREGNTHILIREVLHGAESKGMRTRLVFLDDLRIQPCRGCAQCKDNSTGCVIPDDFGLLLENIRDADLVIIGSPVYMAQVTGQTKTMLDRLYSLRRGDRSMRIDGSKKKGVLVVTCGSEDPAHPVATTRTLGVLYRFLNTPDVVEIVEQGLNPRGAVLARPQSLERARLVGESMADSLIGGENA